MEIKTSSLYVIGLKRDDFNEVHIKFVQVSREKTLENYIYLSGIFDWKSTNTGTIIHAGLKLSKKYCGLAKRESCDFL